jgi:peptidoglycan-associated lipoprotein
VPPPFLAGCSKKPVRPDPSSTALGPQSGGGGNARADGRERRGPDTSLQPRDPNVIDDGHTIRGLLQPVYFDFDRSTHQGRGAPEAAGREGLPRQESPVPAAPRGPLRLAGTSEYNLGLGDRRANEAKKYLISIGVSADKMETLSKGSEEASKNADDATMAKDRRDELVVLKQP